MSELHIGPGAFEPTPINPSTVPLRPSPPFPPTPIPIPEPAPAPEPEPAPEPTPEPLPPLVPKPPQEPSIPGALPDIGILGALLVLLGLIALAKALADFLNWLFRKMLGPLHRRAGSPSIDTQTLLQPLSNTLGAWEARIDTQLGVSFHKLAQLVARVGSAIVAGAALTHQLATQLVRVREHQLQQDGQALKTAHAATSAQVTAQHAATTATTEAHRAREHEQTIEQQHQALVHHVTHVLEPELEGLRHRIPELEKGVHTAWDEITKHAEALSIAGVTAATAIGLEQLGGNWIRCEANQLLGRLNCGRNGDLVRRLLTGALDALIVTDLCAFAGGVTALAQTLQPVMLEFVDVEHALIGCHGASLAAPIVLHDVSKTPVHDAIAV